jgi:hypothetical protein
MMLKNLKDNAKNLAANAKIEDMSRLFKNHMAGKQDVKNALSGVMVRISSLQSDFFELILRVIFAGAGKELVAKAVRRARVGA